MSMAESHSASPWSQIANMTVVAPVAGMMRSMGGDDPGYDVTESGGTMAIGCAKYADVAVNRFPAGSLA